MKRRSAGKDFSRDRMQVCLFKEFEHFSSSRIPGVFIRNQPRPRGRPPLPAQHFREMVQRSGFQDKTAGFQARRNHDPIHGFPSPFLGFRFIYYTAKLGRKQADGGKITHSRSRSAGNGRRICGDKLSAVLENGRGRGILSRL
ncbi:hypothetical protein SDC9_180534 [bioreactor metagenome]|uniref:Uncharacterized protein n=1 Tax=bioreactor metagenome TaxID=1076179 RepID=A0A645H207_9ZZZZ